MTNELKHPRVSIVNCVSEALEMLKFSSEQLIGNAGTDNFDYIIVCWHTTPEVDSFIKGLERKYKLFHPKLKVFRVNHVEIPNIGYVPNLRAMINEGFTKAFNLNEYAGLVNTDQAFYKNWLINLVKHCNRKQIVSSVVIMPRPTFEHYQGDFGITEYGKFNFQKFNKFCNTIIKKNNLRIEQELKGNKCLNLIGFPYLFPKEMWHEVGPWILTLEHGTPDVNFFKKAHKQGFKFVMSLDSIAYHLEGVERGKVDRPAPNFSKKMKYDPISLYSKAKIKLKKELFSLLRKLHYK